MRNNYFTVAYAAQFILKIWTENGKTVERSSPRLRQIVFINGAAAFLGTPGYVAYTGKSTTTRSQEGRVKEFSSRSNADLAESFEVRRARFGRYADNRSTSAFGPSIQVQNALYIPLQLHLSGVFPRSRSRNRS